MGVSDTLDVSGGAGGVTAKYDDMLSTAAALDRIATGLSERVPVIGSVVSNADLIESTVLSPGTAAAVAGHVTTATAGPDGLVPAAASMKATSLRLKSAVTAYRALDRALADATTVGHAVGTPLTLLGLLEFEGTRGLADINTGNFADLRNLPGLAEKDGLSLLYSQPWLVDGLIDDTPALMWALDLGAGPVGGPLLSSWAASHGAVFPPGSSTEATGDVVAFGSLFGVFQAGTGRSTPLDQPHAVDPTTTAPTTFSATMTGIGELGQNKNKSTIRIFDVPQADGTKRWVVEIPGTEEWSPTAGRNPVDLTNNVRLMAGEQTAQNDAIRQAMRQAGIRPGEPVMLAGHSQGGITAASLAADPSTRSEFDITNVYTGGAPIAHFSIPDSVHVLSLEHTEDAVPRLDGQDNPDRPGWVTVHRDPTGYTDGNKGVVDSTPAVHSSSVYADTARLVDQSTDPTLVQQRASFQPFFSGSGPTQVTDYQLTRDLP